MFSNNVRCLLEQRHPFAALVESGLVGRVNRCLDLQERSVLAKRQSSVEQHAVCQAVCMPVMSGTGESHCRDPFISFLAVFNMSLQAEQLLVALMFLCDQGLRERRLH